MLKETRYVVVFDLTRGIVNREIALHLPIQILIL